MMLLFGASVLVVMISFVSIGATDSALLGKTFAPSLAAVLWLGLYLYTSYRAFDRVYLFATAYIACLFVFHLGLLLQGGFGYIRLSAWEGDLGPWAVRAGWYTNLALSCLGIGISAYSLMYRQPRMPATPVVTALAQQNLARLYDIGIGLLIASTIFFIGAFANYGNLLALTRLELFHLSDTRFISVFSMMAPSAAIALVAGSRTRRQRKWAFLYAAFVFLVFLISGQRSTALFPLMAAAVIWVKVGRRIPPLLAGAAALGVLLIIPIVGTLRNMGTYSDIASAEAIETAAKYADIGSAFREMGGSIGPLMYTLMLIPEEEPFRYGSSYLSYLLDVVPNVGFKADSSTSRAAAIEALRTQGEEQALLQMNPGDWASYHIIPQQFLSGGGAGYSGIAEPYFNFGLLGVVVFFLVLGSFLAKLDCLPLILYRNWLLFGVLMFWHLLPTVRNGFAVFVKPAAFTLIVLGIWILVRRVVPMATARRMPMAKAPDAANSNGG